MMLRSILLGLLVVFCGACAPVPTQAKLGFSDERRVVIVGENIRQEIALYYQRKYNALVWFTPYQGKISNTANNFLESGIGPSRAMRVLANELKSINETIGRWEIIVPKIAETYVSSALKTMPAHAIAKARGVFVLIDSNASPEMEAQVKRISDGNFFVAYESQRGQ